MKPHFQHKNLSCQLVMHMDIICQTRTL
uniref:Uncharacterized protein n=1 Tax=Rhizophora mucronata TaxID=61149 RepID=A0A2P2IJH3_RHIMU